MRNPFLETAGPVPDEELALRAQSGDRDALYQLFTFHQPWIFNIAIRMLGRHADAEVATQGILVEALNSLHAFDSHGKFGVWLYRLAGHHLLNFRKQKWLAGNAICSFADASIGLRLLPDFDPPDERTLPFPLEMLIEETAIGCINGTLLCLEGRHRLAFILGEIFGVCDHLGGEILGVTAGAFRQLRSDAAQDLCGYLTGNCGLASASNPCQCARKTHAFIAGGFVDSQKLHFNAGYSRLIREVAGWRGGRAPETYVASFYRGHPFYNGSTELVGQVLAAASLAPNG